TQATPLPQTCSRPDGSFALAGLPRGLGSLSFQCDGHQTVQLDVPAFTLTGQRVVLPCNGVPVLVIAGRVLDERELPVTGALVGRGNQRGRSDDAGRFRLAFQRAPPRAGDALFAAHPGHQTLVLDGFGARAQDPAQRDVVLRLSGPPLSIAG